MKPINAWWAVCAGLGMTVGLGAFVVSATETSATQQQGLTPSMVSTAKQAVQASGSFSQLSGGQQFAIRSTGTWTVAPGELGGATVMVDFGKVVELRGDVPVIEVLSPPISDADRVKGVERTEKIKIRYGKRAATVSASEFLLSVDFTGEIRDVLPVPPRAPAPPLNLTGPTPPAPVPVPLVDVLTSRQGN